MGIRRSMRNIENNSNILMENEKNKTKESDIKKKVNVVLYQYFIKKLQEDDKNYNFFKTIDAKTATQEVIIKQIQENNDIEIYKIKALYNNSYNIQLEKAKKDVDASITKETVQQAFTREINGFFEKAKNINDVYNILLQIKKRNEVCEVFIDTYKNRFLIEEMQTFLQVNYYKIIKQVYNMYLHDEQSKKYFAEKEAQKLLEEVQAQQKIEQEKQEKKEKRKNILFAILWLIISIVLLLLAPLGGWLAGMLKEANRNNNRKRRR